MRFIAFALAAFVASTPALAEGWQEYSYPDYAFAVSFPATPKVETTAYEAPGGRSVEARVYSAAQDKTARVQDDGCRPFGSRERRKRCDRQRGQAPLAGR